MNVLIISHMYPNSFNENNGVFIHKQIEAMLEEFPDINVKVVSHYVVLNITDEVLSSANGASCLPLERRGLT